MLIESQMAALKPGDWIYRVFVEYEADPNKIGIREGRVVNASNNGVEVDFVKNGEVQTFTLPKFAIAPAYFMTKLAGLQSIRRKHHILLEEKKASVKATEEFIKALDEKIISIL